MIEKHHKFMWSFSRSLITSLKRPIFIYLATLSFTIQGFFAVLFYLVESGKNAGMLTFFDSLYYTVTVMSGVGLGDISPQTTEGKLISMVMMLLGTVIFVTFTGALAASIFEIESQHKNQKK